MSLHAPPLAVMGIVLLGAINVWLGAVVMEELEKDEIPPAHSEEANLNLTQALQAGPDVKPLPAYSHISAQPVFFKSRAPFVPPPPPPPPAPPKVTPPPQVHVDPGITLGGVIIHNTLRKAYLTAKTDSQGMWVSEGESISGWKVRSIQSTGTTLEQNARSIELQLYPTR